MEVRGLTGSSENAYAIWAGPTRSQDPETVVPANINARQVYMQRQWLANDIQCHLSKGIGVYGMGHLPMNSNYTGIREFPAAYLGPEYAGQNIDLEFFDLDAGACGSPCPPVVIYFDTIPREDWSVCYYEMPSDCIGENATVELPVPSGWGGNNQWATFEFTVPSASMGVPFYGGRLMVVHDVGRDDTYGLKLTVESVPVLVE